MRQMNSCHFILLQLGFSKRHQTIMKNGVDLLFPVTRLQALVKCFMIVLPCGSTTTDLHLAGYGFTDIRTTGMFSPVTRIFPKVDVSL